MLKKISFLVLILAVGVIVAGCSSNSAAPNDANGSITPNAGDSPSGTARDGNRVSGSADDLAVGKTIMASGVANQDGSVTAAMIIIGDIGNFQRNRSASTTASTIASTTASNGQGFRQGGSGGGQNFASGTPSGTPNGTPRAPRNSNMARVSGEILTKDNASLAVKIADGTTKIVSYSDKTAIYIASTPTSTPASASASTSAPAN